VAGSAIAAIQSKPSLRPGVETPLFVGTAARKFKRACSSGSAGSAALRCATPVVMRCWQLQEGCAGGDMNSYVLWYHGIVQLGAPNVGSLQCLEQLCGVARSVATMRVTNAVAGCVAKGQCHNALRAMI